MVFTISVILIFAFVFVASVLLMKNRKYKDLKEIAPIVFRLFLSGFALVLFVYAASSDDNSIKGIGIFGIIYFVVTSYDYWLKIKKYY